MLTLHAAIDKILKFVCCLLFISMVGVASWQVIARYVLNNPSTVSEALLRFSLVWLSMLAIAYVTGQREHVRLTLLTDKLTGNWRFFSDFSIELLFIIFAAVVLIYGGMQATSNSMSQIYPMLNIPKGLLYLSLPVSGSLIIVYCLNNCLILYKNKYFIRRETP
ncbi:TRAP-type C4-dicarboxylate transport system, small permease component [Halomonas citrativorans]|uniref:TRAP transporter small permease protein n=1 Tax=Halomonas citrativorans TaxID=2742612 RepID=A0A1R4I0H1_9GAMM|nr:TRAP transporter small permease [Halomonas citrativorans]SJN12883.1 TRAP-type C4-dicarboxylate transport system, small permease component [Halomonas citrativorans]